MYKPGFLNLAVSFLGRLMGLNLSAYTFELLNERGNLLKNTLLLGQVLRV